MYDTSAHKVEARATGCMYFLMVSSLSLCISRTPLNTNSVSLYLCPSSRLYTAVTGSRRDRSDDVWPASRDPVDNLSSIMIRVSVGAQSIRTLAMSLRKMPVFSWNSSIHRRSLIYCSCLLHSMHASPCIATQSSVENDFYM
jgi:hypothetical protein